MKVRINERESSPAELAWNEFKNLKGKVRLSESKLRDIIRESVNKVLKEGVLDDYDEAEQRLRAAREKGDTKEIIAAAKEWNRLKDIAKPKIEARKMNNQKESSIPNVIL